MSLQHAIDNLKEFGKELNLQNLEFDENNTCILGIDESFSMHLTYEPNTDRLYLYSPLLDGLPKDDRIKMRLYEVLLEGSMLGGQMAGGGIGVAPQEELILLHCTLDMAHAVSSALRAFAPLFVETIEKWRKKVTEIVEGRDDMAIKEKAAVLRKQAEAGRSSRYTGQDGAAQDEAGRNSKYGGQDGAGPSNKYIVRP